MVDIHFGPISFLYLNRADQRHVLSLDDLEVDGRWGDFRNAGEFLSVQGLDFFPQKTWWTVTFWFHQIWDGEVLQPVVQLEEVAITMPTISVQG